MRKHLCFLMLLALCSLGVKAQDGGEETEATQDTIHSCEAVVADWWYGDFSTGTSGGSDAVLELNHTAVGTYEIETPFVELYDETQKRMRNGLVAHYGIDISQTGYYLITFEAEVIDSTHYSYGITSDYSPIFCVGHRVPGNMTQYVNRNGVLYSNYNTYGEVNLYDEGLHVTSGNVLPRVRRVYGSYSLLCNVTNTDSLCCYIGWGTLGITLGSTNNFDWLAFKNLNVTYVGDDPDYCYIGNAVASQREIEAGDTITISFKHEKLETCAYTYEELDELLNQATFQDEDGNDVDFTLTYDEENDVFIFVPEVEDYELTYTLYLPANLLEYVDETADEDDQVKAYSEAQTITFTLKTNLTVYQDPQNKSVYYGTFSDAYEDCEVSAEGITAYTLSEDGVDTEEKELTFTEVGDFEYTYVPDEGDSEQRTVKGLAQGSGYLCKYETSDETEQANDVLYFYLDPLELGSSQYNSSTGDPTVSVTKPTGNLMVAVAALTTGSELNNGNDYAYVLGKTDSAIGFYKLASEGTIAGGKAYADLSSVLGESSVKVSSLSISFGTASAEDDDTATAIESVAPAAAGSEAVYDLAGRKVSQPVKGSIYISGGKKIIY